MVFDSLNRSNDEAPFIQVNFDEPKYISGVVTQGEGHEEKWVTEFEVYTSVDGINFTPYSQKQDGVTTLFKANVDKITPVTNYFVTNVIAQYIRIVPISSHMGVALR